MDVTVKGKKVVLKDHIGSKQNWHIFQCFQDLIAGTLEYDGIVDLLTAMIESWEYNELDPTKRETFDDLDLFTDTMPLLNAVGAEIAKRVDVDGTKRKNSRRRST